MVELKIKLPTDPRAASAARRGIGALSGFVQQGDLDRLELLVSEVVTNSFRHSGAPSEMFIRIAVEVFPERVRVSVQDAGPGFDMQMDRSDPSTRVGRWGLFLVDQLSDRWGVDLKDVTTVWFEVSAHS